MSRVPQLVHRVREVEVVELGRLLESLEMLTVPEHRGAALRLVGTNALEYAGSVVEPVAEHVDLGVVPEDELAIHPDPLRLLHIPSDVRRPRGLKPGTTPIADFEPSMPDQRRISEITTRVISSVPTTSSPSRARSAVRRPRSSAESTAASIAAASSPIARPWRSIMAADRNVASGFAAPCPAMSGADPWTGSNRPGPSPPRLADGSIPRDPVSIADSSLRMSPNMFSVRTTSKWAGLETSCIAALSTSMCSSSTSA